MSLSSALEDSSRACEGAATALAHLLRSRVNKPNAPADCVAAFQEAQAFAITVRAVMDEAKPILHLLPPDAACVGKNSILSSSPMDVCNGFDAITVILINLLDISNEAILSVAATFSRWVVSPLPAAGTFDRMTTHHNQLRGMYGILHLAGKISGFISDSSKTLFASVNENGTDSENSPSKWRSAIKLDDFYGRHFGFHYTPEMRNVLRIVNIVRSSVHRSHNKNDGTPQVFKNVAMLGWGWIYSNMVIMNNLGVSIDGVTQIGADSDENTMTIERLRKFMNMVEEPLVTSMSGLTSADVTVNSTFSIPPPGATGGLESSDRSDDALQDVLTLIVDSVKVRVMSSKGRPLDLSLERLDKMKLSSEKSSRVMTERGNSDNKVEKTLRQTIEIRPEGESKDQGQVKVTQEATLVETKNGTVVRNDDVLSKKATSAPPSFIPGPSGAVSAVVDNSYLATTIKSEFKRLQSNMSNLLGIEEKKPAKALIMYFHGGGFVSQSSEAHSVYLKEWCSAIEDAVIFSVDYKLAPEHAYPSAICECVYAYLWALQNASRLGTLAERIVFAGDSAGGNLAVAVALKVNELGIRAADGLCLAYPSLLVTAAWSPSRLLSFFDPLMPLSVLELCQKSYVPEGCDGAKDPFISPLLATDDQLEKLPPVTVICGALDPLLDDTAEFAQRLHDVRDGDLFRVYQKLPHGFLNMIPVNELARDGMWFLGKMIAQYLNISFRSGANSEVKKAAANPNSASQSLETLSVTTAPPLL